LRWSALYHSRTEATDVIAEVKVSIVNEDFIRVVIDFADIFQLSGEGGEAAYQSLPGRNRSSTGSYPRLTPILLRRNVEFAFESCCKV
jgi:hypothetical protein